MNILRNALIFCAAAAACIILGRSLPIYADTKPEDLPAEETFAPVENPPVVSVLSPICDAINEQRAAAGTEPLTLDATLMDMAEQRVSEFERNPDTRAAAINGLGLSSETVILGNADPNTALSAVVLNEKQHSNLVYEGYHSLGIACNETNNIWILILAS